MLRRRCLFLSPPFFGIPSDTSAVKITSVQAGRLLGNMILRYWEIVAIKCWFIVLVVFCGIVSKILQIIWYVMYVVWETTNNYSNLVQWTRHTHTNEDDMDTRFTHPYSRGRSQERARLHSGWKDQDFTGNCCWKGKRWHRILLENSHHTPDITLSPLETAVKQL